MSKLTLPLQAGKKYVRRDGSVVTVTHVDNHRERHMRIATCEPGGSVWADSGRGWRHREVPDDLVADYIEPKETNMPQESKYAEIFHWLADGKAVQRDRGNGWETATEDQVCYSIGNHVDPKYFRLKPATHFINGIEVPEPLRETPPNGTTVFLVNPMVEELYSGFVWGCRPSVTQSRWLKIGLVHINPADAVANAKAMLAFKESA